MVSLFLDNIHPLIIIENAAADSQDELMLIKDSYANSIVPFGKGSTQTPEAGGISDTGAGPPHTLGVGFFLLFEVLYLSGDRGKIVPESTGRGGFLQRGKQFKYIGAEKPHPVLQTVQRRVFLCLRNSWSRSFSGKPSQRRQGEHTNA